MTKIKCGHLMCKYRIIATAECTRDSIELSSKGICVSQQENNTMKVLTEKGIIDIELSDKAKKELEDLKKKLGLNEIAKKIRFR